MTVPPRGPEPASQLVVVAPPEPSPSPAAWAGAGVVAQFGGAAVFTGLLATWAALGASLFAATAAALAMCIAIPILGWFFGLPIVLAFGAFAGAMWVGGFMLLASAWAITALTMAVFTFAGAMWGRRGG
jgi:hypothetical protein